MDTYGKIYGFIQDGQTYRVGLASTQTLSEPAVYGNEQQCSFIAFATALILRVVGGVTGKLKWPSTLLRQLSFWRCTDLATAKPDAYTFAPLHAD